MRDALIAVQRRDGLSDGQMALRLGCSRPYWNLIRNGKRNFPHDLAIRAAGEWPELTRHLLDMAEQSAANSATAPIEAAS